LDAEADALLANATMMYVLQADDSKEFIIPYG
jgi:hypothetical protein